MATPIQSDDLGFLVGNRADLARAVQTLLEIHRELHELNTRLGSGPPANANADPVPPQLPRRRYRINPDYLPPQEDVPPGVPRRGSNANRLRDSRGRLLPNAPTEAPDAVPPQTNDEPTESASDESEDRARQRKKEKGDDSLLKLAQSAIGVVGSAPDIDPTIAAAKEVGAAIAPIGRGFGKLFGSDKSKDNKVWYRRIWNELRGERRESADFHRAELRRLQAIEEANRNGGGGGSGGGLFGGIAGLLGKIPGVGAIGKFLASAGGGLLKVGGGLLKRLPLIGGIVAAASAAASIFGPDDPDKTPEENRQDRFTGGGGGVGALIGGALGTFLGPIGTVVGGIIGNKVGELVGAWLATFDWSKIGDQIVGAWNTTTKFFSDSWGVAVGAFTSYFDTVKALWSGIFSAVKNFVKDKFGIDIDGVASKAKSVATESVAAVKEAAAPIVDRVKSIAAPIVEKVSPAVSAAVDYAKATPGRLVAPIGRALTGVKDWALGSTSKQFESGRGGAGTVSTGVGDNGGASYGTYQLSSKKGTLNQFLKDSKYGPQFDGLQPGTKEFDAKWKDVAKTDPDFGSAQHDFIKTNHFDPQMAKLKDGGVDLSGRGSAVQDAVWSTAVQFGGGTGLIQNALKGKDSSKLSDAEIVTAIQDYKIANNDTLFKISSANVRAGTLARAGTEKSSLLKLASGSGDATSNIAVAQAATTPSAVTGVPAITAAPMSSASVVSTAPKASETPPASMPSSARPTPVEVNVNQTSSGDVGQDISDRKIAHIATGGIGGSMYG